MEGFEGWHSSKWKLIKKFFVSFFPLLDRDIVERPLSIFYPAFVRVLVTRNFERRSIFSFFFREKRSRKDKEYRNLYSFFNFFYNIFSVDKMSSSIIFLLRCTQFSMRYTYRENGITLVDNLFPESRNCKDPIPS